MAKALVHAWWSAEEDCNVLVGRVYSRESGLAYFYQEWRNTRFCLEVLVVSQCKGRGYHVAKLAPGVVALLS